MDAKEKSTLDQLAWIAVPLVLAVIFLVAFIPSLSTWLVYDRNAILRGELWRMFTGHWVHFSSSHLFSNTLAFGIVAVLVQNRGVPHFVSFCLWTPWFISSALLIFESEMKFYGGLSGFVTAAICYFALTGFQGTSGQRWMSGTMLCAIAAKCTFEMKAKQCVFAVFEDAVVPSATAHLAGASIAVIFHICSNNIKPWQSTTSERQNTRN